MYCTPLVSIIIPVYNQEPYLSVSLASAKNQTYNNLDIIVVNDGSTDAGLSIIQSFCDSDSRFQLINQENQGLVSAVITGIKHAKGQYIAFLDPDDHLGPDYIAHFMHYMSQDEALDFVAAGFYYDELGETTPYHLLRNQLLNKQNLNLLKKQYIMKHSLNISNELFISRWNKLYKADLIKRIMMDYEMCRNISVGEDTVFTYLVLRNGTKGMILKKPNTYYYNVSNSQSMSKSANVYHNVSTIDTLFYTFDALLKKNNDNRNPALAITFLQLNNLFWHLFLNTDKTTFCTLMKQLKKKPYYNRSLIVALPCTITWRERLLLILRLTCPNPSVYLLIHNFLKRCTRRIIK